MSEGLVVSGGAGGITAQYDDMDAVGDLLRSMGGDLVGLTVDGHGLLVAANVSLSAILDPIGAARFEGAMIGALDGPQGLALAAAAIELDGIRLGAAVVTYRTVDDLLAEADELRRYTTGYAVGVTAPFWAPFAAVGGLSWWGGRLLDGGDPAAELERYLTEHPGIVDEIVGSSPGFMSGATTLFDLATAGQASRLVTLLTGESAYPGTLAEGAALVAALYEDGHPEVAYTSTDLEGAAATVPGGVEDLFGGLNRRNSGGPGEIDVRTITYVGPDGQVHRSHIVDIPGTKEWNPPFEHTDVVNDFGTNITAIAGQTTTYERGVAEALRQAGVSADEPVMLVGHSQGGMVALHSANSFVTNREFNVTAVVTAGSPVAGIPVPDPVRVLSVENSVDIVPRLDSLPNPDRHNWTSVQFTNQTHTVGGNHGIDSSYVPAGRQIDVSTDESITAWRSSVAGTFFFDEGADASVRTDVYTVTRKP